jgi:hypothetical protein
MLSLIHFNTAGSAYRLSTGMSKNPCRKKKMTQSQTAKSPLQTREKLLKHNYPLHTVTSECRSKGNNPKRTKLVYAVKSYSANHNQMAWTCHLILVCTGHMTRICLKKEISMLIAKL